MSLFLIHARIEGAGNRLEVSVYFVVVLDSPYRNLYRDCELGRDFEIHWCLLLAQCKTTHTDPTFMYLGGLSSYQAFRKNNATVSSICLIQ